MQRFTQWLEHRWVNPAYVGWLLLGLALFFFAAATNTLAGWLYVISGTMLALLLVAAVLPPRNLRGLTVRRSPLAATTAGDRLALEIQVHNPQRETKGLFQIIDRIDPRLGPGQTTAVESLPGGQRYTWRWSVPTERRGIYRWHTIDLRTAAPLGLFWSRRSWSVEAVAVVYPPVLGLRQCPLLDTVGLRQGQSWRFNPAAQADTQGVTRSLRPYRWGDPTRLIHWRTSARYGELRVRELETMTNRREVVIALNASGRWPEASFEQAVVATASLYAYALRQGFAAALWLPQPIAEGAQTLLWDRAQVMHALAAVEPLPVLPRTTTLPRQATIWLTATALATASGSGLASGSRQVVWGSGGEQGAGLGTVYIDPEAPLEPQLQRTVNG